MENIFTRISDIITANINALIDQAENPEVMFTQITREMETSICLAKRDAVEAIAAEKRLAKEMGLQQEAVAQWLLRAEIGIRNKDDDLARKALTRKQEHEKICEELTRSLNAARDASDSLKNQLREMCRKLDEVKRRAISLKVRQRAAVSRTRISGSLAGLQRSKSIQCDLDRMVSKITDMEARAEAMAELHDTEDNMERQFDVMEINLAVEKEMAVLKGKLSPAAAD